MKINYPYLCSDRDRHGNMRVYYRRRGNKVRLRAPLGSAEFHTEYEAAAGLARAPRNIPGTYRGLIQRYVLSPEFQSLDPSTQRQRRRVLEATCLETLAPASTKLIGDCPLKKFGRQHVRVLRDRKATHREAARHRLKAISQMFEWALENDVADVEINPVRQVKFPRPLPGGGHHTWTSDEKQRFERQHLVGSKARLAFALLYYTGLRVSDVVRLGKHHIQADGSLRITLHKNRNRYPITLQLPILDELQRILDASDLGRETFLVTEWGKPFASESAFGNKMRDWCDQAGLRRCTAHGLRKSGATIAAENGATPHELKAMFGWLTLKQAEAYTRMAEQKRLAARGMLRLGQKQAAS